MTTVFNYSKFYRELNKKRKMRGIAWNKVATRSGIATSGIFRFVKHFEDPANNPPKGLSIEVLVKLMNWMNQTDLAPFLTDEDDPDVTV